MLLFLFSVCNGVYENLSLQSKTLYDSGFKVFTEAVILCIYRKNKKIEKKPKNTEIFRFLLFSILFFGYSVIHSLGEFKNSPNSFLALSRYIAILKIFGNFSSYEYLLEILSSFRLESRY